MFKRAGVLFLYTETPLHPGSGTSVGLTDLPIQREKATHLPIMQPTGLKGVFRDFVSEEVRLNEKSRSLEALRAHLEQAEDEEEKAKLQEEIRKLEKQRKNLLQSSGIQAVFGPETDEADAHGGAISFTEARVVLFPVRSLVGVYAWVTCPQALARLHRDLAVAKQTPTWKVPPQPDEGEAWITENSTVSTGSQIVLEEYTFEGRHDRAVDVAAIAKWLSQYALPNDGAHEYWGERLFKESGREKPSRSNLVVLRDEDFRDFTVFGTEVVTRIRIDPAKGTVASGALWTEEHIPAETLMYTLVLATDPRTASLKGLDGLEEKEPAEKVLAYLTGKVSGQVVQMGGDATVGRGLVHVRALEQSQEQSGGATSQGEHPLREPPQEVVDG